MVPGLGVPDWLSRIRNNMTAEETLEPSNSDEKFDAINTTLSPLQKSSSDTPGYILLERPG